MKILSGGCIHCDKKYCSERVKIFSYLDENELRKINDLIVRRELEKGEMLFAEGETIENLYVVNEGKLKGFKINLEGKEQIIYIFTDGDLMGELAILRGEKLGFSVEAIEDTNLCTLDKEDFRRLLLSNPSIALKILEVTAKKTQELETLIESLGMQNATLRIARMLAELAKKYGIQVEDGIEVDISMKQEDIANYVGIARETVSRKLGKLQDQGIIRFLDSKKLLVKDIERLINYTE